MWLIHVIGSATSDCDLCHGNSFALMFPYLDDIFPTQDIFVPCQLDMRCRLMTSFLSMFYHKPDEIGPSTCNTLTHPGVAPLAGLIDTRRGLVSMTCSHFTRLCMRPKWSPSSHGGPAEVGSPSFFSSWSTYQWFLQSVTFSPCGSRWGWAPRSPHSPPSHLEA